MRHHLQQQSHQKASAPVYLPKRSPPVALVELHRQPENGEHHLRKDPISGAV